jgi:signal transduction histidine kinase
VAAPKISAELRRLLHQLRQPLAAFAIRIELLEGEPQTPAAQQQIKAIRASIHRAAAVFEEIDFVLQNGHTRSKGA